MSSQAKSWRVISDEQRWVISRERRSLRVIDHAGDNFLGGKDFDEKLLDYLIRKLQREAGLRVLDPRTDRKAFAKLLAEAENAKVQLSNSSSAYISITDLGRGLEDFEASFELTRSEFERLIEPFIRRTIEICQQLLDTNHLSNHSVSRIILVGGPTLTPLVRSAVEGGLGIKPEFKVDPMTIVATGAALFAGSQRTPQTQAPRPAKGVLRLRLVYSPVSQEIETDVAGKLEDAAGLAQAQVEISRADGGWSSGKLSLTNNAFMASLVLNDRAVNAFQIKVFDKTGNALSVDPENFTITHGPMVEDAPLSRAISLGLSDNTTHVLIRKGATVPCQGRTKRGEIVTAHEVSKGEMKDVLSIPLLQGENERSDRNREIGTLRVSGKDISRTLPAGSDVEMVVEIDRDFKVKVNAFIPLLNQSFPIIFGDTIAPLPRVEDMQADLEAEKQRLALLGKHHTSASVPPIQVGEVGSTVKELEGQLEKARVKDPDAAERVRRGIEELKARIDQIEESQKWPSILNRLEEVKQVTSEAVQGSTERKDFESFERILVEAKSAVESKDLRKLEKVVSSLESLTWQIWARQDDFWLSAFQNVSKHAGKFMDPTRGNSLIEEGALAIERADFASLRSIVRELWALVPDSEETTKEKMQFPSSLRKRTFGYL